jgi:hypothetical protein
MSRGLGRIERGVLAVLLETGEALPAHRIIERTVFEPVTRAEEVSVRRALASLHRKGLVERDGRKWGATDPRQGEDREPQDTERRAGPSAVAEERALLAKILGLLASAVARLSPAPDRFWAERDEIAGRLRELARTAARTS